MKNPLLLLVLIVLLGGPVFQAEASLDTRLIDAAEAGEAAEVRKLLGRLPTEELRRLSKSGRGRSAIKRMIVGKLDGGG